LLLLVQTDEERKQKEREYYQTHKEDYRRRGKEWNEKNRERRNEQARLRRLKDPEKFKKYRKEWMKANPDKVKAGQKKYYHKNKEARKKNSQKWINENPERYQKRSAEYRKSHVQQFQKRNKDRRLLVLNHYSKILSNSNIPICKDCRLVGNEFLHIDHIDGIKNKEEVKHIRAGSNLINYLIREDFPVGYQVLCGNCNWLKHFESTEKTLSTKRENVVKRNLWNNLKKEVMNHYSKGKTKCVCCGFDNLLALTIDHVVGRKNVTHRKDYQGKLLYYWLRRNNYPKDFQVLCIMCNLAKHDNDVCPHERN
jgi:hypothetical protein